ncbi:MAG TPA: bifunctional aspartate kinase/diaminopimelate decarboxylase [Gammaproteobacteria bacterium]|nr:bifunctional aspartate kinase/diaminopimelate decarboxylase [Gammaproteobacteria bacterium]
MTMQTHAALGVDNAVETPFADSPWVVMKFGGRSVATAENWARIAGLIRARLDEGVKPVVVHSALVGVSNALIDLLDTAVAGEPFDEKLGRIKSQHTSLAAELGVDVGILDGVFEKLDQMIAGVRLVGEVSPRVHARVLATGELAATELGAAYLKRIGLPAVWHDARRLLTSSSAREQSERQQFLSARCDFSPSQALQQQLAAVDGFVVTQGFIASNAQGQTVLLGRGGSDTSAAYLAAMLEARRLENWTDVPGFFSADPKAVPNARLIRSLHYREAQEIASAGGGILHPRSISPARSLGIPLFLKCTAHPEWEGTVISNAPGDDTPQLKAISQRSGITLISMESLEMWHQVGFLAEAFGAFRSHGVSVDLISTSESNVTVSVDIGQNAVDQSVIDALVRDLEKLCRVVVIRDCAAITLVGRRIRTILHELTSVLELFEEYQVHLVTQAATDLNMTFVVSSENAHRIVQQLHGLLVSRFEGGVFGATWEQFQGKLPAPAQAAKPWWVDRRGELLAIAARRGSAYVYERRSIEAAIDSLKALPSVDAVLFAMKANSHPDVLRIVHERGLWFECVSPGEISRVLGLFPQLDRKHILFTPNFAPRKEYEWGVEQGVWLTLDNLYPLQAWGDLFRGRELFIRIDTGRGRGHHEHVRTAGAHSKFGVPLFEVPELARLARKAKARVVGLHAHTGSGILTADSWRDTGQHLVGLLEHFPEVRYLDLGGGLGVPEKPGQRPLDMEAFGEAIEEIKRACGDREIWLEPGRYVVAQAGVLVAQVTQTKGKGEVQYVGVTTGMNSLIRPALYGAYHEITNLTRLGEAATEVVTVVGPICETGDRLGSDRLLPVTREGDVLLISNAGAYGYVMSSHYNLREPAEEVVI